MLIPFQWIGFAWRDAEVRPAAAIAAAKIEVRLRAVNTPDVVRRRNQFS
jgi:hypothetical protein